MCEKKKKTSRQEKRHALPKEETGDFVTFPEVDQRGWTQDKQKPNLGGECGKKKRPASEKESLEVRKKRIQGPPSGKRREE